ncbi:FecR domain-containing protein [Desulfovibrio sp. OttesenSCG-928-G15]|nr:FecR domain-containing protein [Desulfovibrio sp. OttesenSCG-928-G15]
MQAAATCTSVTGQVTVDRNGKKLTVTKGMELFVTDTVHTGKDGKVSVRFRDDTELDLHPDTHAKLEDFAFDPGGTPPPTFAVEVLQGLARTATGKVVQMNPDGFAIKTPLGTAGIRGTTIWTHVTSSQVVFSVTEMGKGHVVVVSSPDGSTLLIKVPDSGVVITSKGEATLNMEHLTPEKLQKFIEDVVGKATDNDAHISATSHGVFVIADAEFLASIGAINITDELGFIAAEDSDLMIDALALLGFSMDEHFINYSHIPQESSPYNYIYGTPGNDVLTGTSGMDRIYAYGGNDRITGGKGNDTIWSGAGQDTISGGYGSFDEIYKQADLNLTVIYGDVKTLRGATGDADYIEVGTSSANEHYGAVYGDADSMSNNAMPGNDVIKVHGTLRGWVSGDASVFDGVKVGTDAATGDEAHGRDSIYVETLGGGLITGDSDSVRGTVSGNVANAFNDTISVGTMNGIGLIIGDFLQALPGTDFSGLGPKAFADLITVGSMTAAGSICGDISSPDADGLTMGKDTIKITGNMAYGTIYGDAGTAKGNNLTFGNDLISVGGNMTNSARIFGDAGELYGAGGKLGNDTISVAGNMDSSAIYGDLLRLYAYGKLGHDKISVHGNMKNSVIFGDVSRAGATGVVYGNDTIAITGSMKSDTVYGDAFYIEQRGAPGNDSITTGSADYYSQIFGDADNFGDVQVTAQSGGNDTITVTELTGTIYGDATNLSGAITAASAPSKGAFSDVITVNTVTDYIAPGEDHRPAIYGDFKEITDSAQINLSGSAHNNAFSDKITVGTLGGDVYGDAQTLGIRWTIGGHDTINVTTLDGGSIVGDFALLGTGSSNSVFGNDVITINRADGGWVHGDTAMGAPGEIMALSGFRYGNDKITIKTAGNDLYIYGDDWGISPDSQLGNDTIDASQAIISGQSVIYGDGCNLYGADLTNASRLGNDLIKVGTMRSTDVTIYGDGVFLEGTITGNQNNAFNDTIEIGTMEGGRVYGDVAHIDSASNIVMSGSGLFNDVIRITTMKGGTVYGDTTVIKHGDNVYSGVYGGNTIEVGSMSGGSIYGSAEELDITNGAISLDTNTIKIGTLKGTGEIWAHYGTHTTGTLSGCYSYSSVTINNFQSGAVHLSDGKDTLTIKSLAGYQDGQSIIEFGGGQDVLDLGGGGALTYSPTTTVTIDKDLQAPGSSLTIDLTGSGLVVNVVNPGNALDGGGKLYLTQGASDGMNSGVILNFGGTNGGEIINIIA